MDEKENQEENSDFILIEFVDPDGDDISPTKVHVGKKVSEKLIGLQKEAIKKVTSIIPALSNEILNQVETIDPKPKELSVEFGFSLNAEGKIYVVGFSSQSTFKIKLSWKS